MTELPISDWNYPTRMRVGAGRINELAEVCKELGMSAPLLVTDPGLAALPMLEEAAQQCRDTGLRCELFSDIKGNPTAGNIEAGIAAFREKNCDGVIAFGGGSALDAGKTIALMGGQKITLWELEDKGDNWTRADTSVMAPVVAVPTTAGTGSEVGRAAVITDAEHKAKKIIFHPNMLPRQVILDPQLTVGLPAKLTAATGMDALSHNLEALCANAYHPMAEGIAVRGIELVKNFLPRACENGSDLEARTQMLVASSMGATAFQRGLGAMHALSHSLGALYDSHHGLLNAIVMPYVLKANERAVNKTLAAAAAAIGLQAQSYSGFMDWVLELRARVGIPDNLAEIGITAAEAERVGEMAVQDSAAAGNPISFSAAEYSTIFSAAVDGRL
ncbi:MAG: iron-containing alcohol dehydrogenase [Gammaproteobacteria bacterium]|nr:iron-containing alcohol dehydrogenase [Gammaproteobacteria bacterium]